MREEYRELRRRIRSMPTKMAAEFVAAFRLPSEEDAAVTLMDIRKLSTIQAAGIMGLSPDTVKNRRAAAYARMIQELESLGD